jgi:hypothetical protein
MDLLILSHSIIAGINLPGVPIRANYFDMAGRVAEWLKAPDSKLKSHLRP